MDGTLVDTEPYWIEAEFALAEKYGGTWSHEHAMNLVGNDLLDSGRYIREHMGIDLEPSRDRRGAARPGDRARRARGAVAARGRGAAGRPEPQRRARARWSRCPTGGSWRPILAALPGGRVRDAWSPATRCRQGKPHPEPYLKAARNLGVRARRLPGHRGLQHRRPVRRGGRLHRARRAQPRPGAAGGAPVFRDSLVGRDCRGLGARSPEIVARSRPNPAVLSLASPGDLRVSSVTDWPPETGGRILREVNQVKLQEERARADGGRRP